MKRLADRVFVLLCVACVPVAVAGSLPFHPQTVPSISDTDPEPHRRAQAIVKVSVSLDEEVIANQVSVGHITLCTDSACYRSEQARQSITLFNTRDGTSETVAQVLLPFQPIRSIHFETLAGSGVLEGDIALAPPLSMANVKDGLNAQGGEILVLAKKFDDGKRTLFRPTAVTSALRHRDFESVYYNPSFATKSRLKHSAIFSLPKGATPGPQIFSVSVHDVLDTYPMIGINPEITFTVPAFIASKPVSRPSTKNAALPPFGMTITTTGTFRLGQ